MVASVHRTLAKSRLSNPPSKYPYQPKKTSLRMSFLVGGGRWIRTTEVVDNRFTVCPLWPLGNSPIFSLLSRLGGAGRRTRTPDLLITNQLLYQLSYTGDSNSKLIIARFFRLSTLFFKNVSFFVQADRIPLSAFPTASSISGDAENAITWAATLCLFHFLPFGFWQRVC